MKIKEKILAVAKIREEKIKVGDILDYTSLSVKYGDNIYSYNLKLIDGKYKKNPGNEVYIYFRLNKKIKYILECKIKASYLKIIKIRKRISRLEKPEEILNRILETKKLMETEENYRGYRGVWGVDKETALKNLDYAKNILKAFLHGENIYYETKGEIKKCTKKHFFNFLWFKYKKD